MAQIVAFFSIYNEIDLLPRAVDSIIDYVDEIIFVDGRYKGFRGVTKASNDGTVEYIKTVPKGRYVLCDGLEEWEVRNLMFSETKIGDWVVAIDGDEVVSGAENLKNLQGRTTPLVCADIHGNIWPRIFKNDGKGRFDHSHCIFNYDGYIFSILKQNELMSTLRGFKIDNRTWERDDNRKKLQSEYYEALNKQEGDYYAKFQ
jgi:hypothetical protein